MSEVVRVAAPIPSAIRAHAEACYPEECCGALLGWSRGSPDHDRGAPGASPNVAADRVLVRAVPLANEWAGQRASRYLIPAAVVRALEAEGRRTGLELVGFYHSHPDGAAEPSPFDREVGWPWYSYLIVAVSSGRAGALRSWRLSDDRSGFVEQTVVTQVVAEQAIVEPAIVVQAAATQETAEPASAEQSRGGRAAAERVFAEPGAVQEE